MNKTTDFKLVFMLAGAFIAYSVGSSFGSGQEIMQWFASHGLLGLLGYFLTIVLITLYVVMLGLDCRKYGLSDCRTIARHYCGKYLGTVIEWYTVIYIFCLAAIMIAGSGATFEEYYGINSTVGCVIMATLVLVCVLLGFQRVISTIGFMGPVILLFVMLVAIISLANPIDGLSSGNQLMSELPVTRAGSNWFLATLLYFSYVIMVQVPYIGGLASNCQGNDKEMSLSFIIGNIGMLIAASLVILAFVSNASFLYDKQVPTLALGSQISPVFGALFGVILLAAIFTTAAPMAWSVVTSFIKEEHKYYKPLVIVVVAAAFAFGNAFSFVQLINVVTSVSGWVGLLFIAAVLVTKLFRKPTALEYPGACGIKNK